MVDERESNFELYCATCTYLSQFTLPFSPLEMLKTCPLGQKGRDFFGSERTGQCDSGSDIAGAVAVGENDGGQPEPGDAGAVSRFGARRRSRRSPAAPSGARLSDPPGPAPVMRSSISSQLDDDSGGRGGWAQQYGK